MNDGFSSGFQGLLYMAGVAELVVLPWGFAFRGLPSPWTRGARLAWGVWIVASLPGILVGLLATLSLVQGLRGR